MDSAGKRKAQTSLKDSSASKNLCLESNGSLADSVLAALKSTENKIQLMEERIQERISGLYTQLSGEIASLERKFSVKLQESIESISVRVEKVESRCCRLEEDSAVVIGISAELSKVREELDKLKEVKQSEHSSDAVIFGLPFSNEEKLSDIFDCICKTIEFTPPPIRNIFRTKRTTERPNSAVIVKFHSSFDRTRTLSAFSRYGKKNHSSVSLKSVGFDSDNTISIFESLSVDNRKILQAAIKLRKQKKLHSAFSRRGGVFVRMSANSEPIAVTNNSELSDLVGGA